jgi:hypothetical protein
MSRSPYKILITDEDANVLVNGAYEAETPQEALRDALHGAGILVAEQEVQPAE